MKKRGFGALLIAVILIGVVIIDNSLHLLNQPSNFAVFLGVAQILIVGIIAPTILVKIYRRIK